MIKKCLIMKLFLLLTMVIMVMAINTVSSTSGTVAAAAGSEDGEVAYSVEKINRIGNEEVVESSDQSELPRSSTTGVSLSSSVRERERGETSRLNFFGQNQPQAGRGMATCNYYPRICRMKGSPGPDCCKKKCVNVFTDKLNCGRCGLKCKYYEICCKGRCVNPFSDKKHCGGCNNKCKKGNYCMYGMCSYA